MTIHFEFIEAAAFTSYLPDYLSDEEYTALQEHLCETPESGDLVRGSPKAPETPCRVTCSRP
jgi:hypothetical protein